MRRSVLVWAAAVILLAVEPWRMPLRAEVSPFPQYQAGDLLYTIPNPDRAGGVSSGSDHVGAMGQLLIVGFFVENTSAGDASLNPMAFQLTDSQGQTYAANARAMTVYYQLRGFPGAIDNQAAPPHFRRSLGVIFDVPASGYGARYQLMIPGRSEPVPLIAH